MTDLRELDRQCAELYFKRMGEYKNGEDGEIVDGGWFAYTDDNHIVVDENFQPSSNPAAASLLIEDLRKDGVRWHMGFGNNDRDPTSGILRVAFFCKQELDYDLTGGVLVQSSESWCEAVARFYVAVKGGSE